MPNTREMELLVNKAFQNSVKNYGAIYAPYVARDLLDCGVTVQKWIPVSERLPKVHKTVLICTDGQVHEAFLKGDGGWLAVFGDSTNINPSKVTHWMPLPEPPKGE